MRAWWLCVLVACGSRHEGDIPMRVTNPPTCPAGRTPAKQVVIRLEHGTDYVQQSITGKMIASSAWANRSGTLKLGLCALDDACPSPAWVMTRDVVVHGDDHGLEVTLPADFALPCSDVAAH